MLIHSGSKLALRRYKPSTVLRRLFLIFALLLTLISSSLNHSPKVSAAAPAVPAGWTNVFTDDFNGAANTGVNTTNWQYTTGTGYPGGPANFGTGEVETMTNSTANVYLDGAGNLNIKAIRGANGAWTSGRIETKRSDFQPPAGGILHVESRLQLPNVTGAAGQGYWPAFWMLGSPYRGNWWNWPGIGEIDIMENVQGINQVWGTMHCGTSPGGPCNEKSGIGGNKSGFSPSLQTAFHTYAVEWDRSVSPETVRWYIDGIQYHQVSANQVDAATWTNATNHGYFIIFNLAMGGEFPAALGGGPTGATASGGTMKVDYLAIWSKSGGGGGGGTTVATPTFSPAGGSYTSAQSVTISTATAGAQIRYTTNGATPTTTSPLYSGPITVSSSQTIKAIGIKSGLTNSAVASATYTIGNGGGGGTGTEWTYGVDNLPADQAKIWFKPTGFTAGYVIVHYTRPGLAQQNLNMAFNGGTGRWETTASGLASGQQLSYGYTYSKNGIQYDTPFYTWNKP